MRRLNPNCFSCAGHGDNMNPAGIAFRLGSIFEMIGFSAENAICRKTGLERRASIRMHKGRSNLLSLRTGPKIDSGFQAGAVVPHTGAWKRAHIL